MALDKIVAGDSLSFFDSESDYPPTAGWTLKYRLTPIFTTPVQAPVTLTAATEGNGYRITASPGTTASWDAGSYSWARWVEKPGARVTLDPVGNAKAPLAALLQVLPNPSRSVQGYDPRSPARKRLDDLNDVLSGWGPQSHIKAYSIAGRSMEFRDRGAVIAELSQAKSDVTREDWKAKIDAGLPNPRMIGVRLSR